MNIKRYFETLAYALKGKRPPSGLAPKTWFKIYVTGESHRFAIHMLTDADGYPTPFKIHGERFTWIAPPLHQVKLSSPASAVTKGWMDELEFDENQVHYYQFQITVLPKYLDLKLFKIPLGRKSYDAGFDSCPEGSNLAATFKNKVILKRNGVIK